MRCKVTDFMKDPITDNQRVLLQKMENVLHKKCPFKNKVSVSSWINSNIEEYMRIKHEMHLADREAYLLGIGVKDIYDV